MRKTLLTLTGLAGLALLTAGCAAMTSNAPPPALYRLTPQNMAAPVVRPEAGEQAPLVIAVSEPRLPPGFSGKNIVLHFDGGRRQDYYADAEWADSLDELLREFIGGMTRAAYPGSIVETDRSGLAARYIVRTDVLDFQPEYQGAPGTIPEIHVRIRFTLQDGETQDALSDFIVERRVAPSQNTLTAIAAALERGLQDAVLEALGSMAGHIVDAKKGKSR